MKCTFNLRGLLIRSWIPIRVIVITMVVAFMVMIVVWLKNYWHKSYNSYMKKIK